MLNDMILSQAAMGFRRVDVHKHATFRCAVSRFFRYVLRLAG